MKIYTSLKFSVIATLLLISHSLISQIPGQIFDPSTGIGSNLVLDPNSDGYITSSGGQFTGATPDEGAQFEQSDWITVFHLMTEPNSDLQTGQPGDRK